MGLEAILRQTGLQARLKGWTGELKTRFVSGLFLSSEYKVFNNVIIRTKRGSTQIDHVIVSPYGLFAIETKDKDGWIYGDERQKQWTEVFPNRKYRFQNPLHQNYAHTMGLAEYLGIEHEKIHSLVIFWGKCEFRTAMPDNVCRGGILSSRFRDYIGENKTGVVIPRTDRFHLCKIEGCKGRLGFLQWSPTY